MAKRIIRLTETQLTNLVKRIVQEQNKIGSFDDEHGWYDEEDRKINSDDFGDDYDEEEFDDFESLHSKHGKDTKWFSPSDGKKMFDSNKEKTKKPFRVRTRRNND